VLFWLHCSQWDRGSPFWVRKNAMLCISWWFSGKLCLSAFVSPVSFAIFVSSRCGP